MKYLWLTLLFGFCFGCASRSKYVEYPYLDPLSSPGAEFGGLPPAAQSAIRSQIGAVEMREILKTNMANRVVYEVHFQDPTLYPQLYVSQNGSVLYPNGTIAVAAGENNIGAFSGGPVNGVRFSDLPVKVARVIQEKAPTSEVAFVNKISVGPNIYYQVTFKDQHLATPMLISEDGTVLQNPPQ
jgi:hypothetical protein